MTETVIPGLGNSGGWTRERVESIPQYKTDIVELIRQGLFISEIAENLDIHPSTIRKWRTQDKEFDEAYSDAEAAYLDTVEKEAVRRAVQGVAEPVIAQGRVVMDPENPGKPLMLRRYSDGLMMFILKGRRRDVYGDKVQTENKHSFDLAGEKEALAGKIQTMLERDGNGIQT